MSQQPDSLQTRLARLAAEIRPERDLWAAIDARLGDRRPAWHVGLGIAAGVAILVLSLIVSLKPRASMPGTTATMTMRCPIANACRLRARCRAFSSMAMRTPGGTRPSGTMRAVMSPKWAR